MSTAFVRERKLGKLRRRRQDMRLDSQGMLPSWFDTRFAKWLVPIVLWWMSRNQSYQPDPYRVHRIDLDGKERDIYQMGFFDYLLCQGLVRRLEQKTQPHYSSSLYSFRSGLSSHKLVEDLSKVIAQHKGRELFIFKADFSHYDQSMFHSQIVNDLRYFSAASRNELDLMLRFLRTSCHHGRVAKRESSYQSTEGLWQLFKGLPTGTPLVPFIDNLYLLELDVAIRDLDLLFYARYGDDLIVVSPDVHKVQQAQALCFSIGQRRGLILKESKCRRLRLVMPGYPLQSMRIASDFQNVFEFEHLGVALDHRGMCKLPARKSQVLRKLIRAQIRDMVGKLKFIGQEPEIVATQVFDALRVFFEAPGVNQGAVSELLYITNNPKELSAWDRYMKLCILHELFGGFRGGLFSKVPRHLFYTHGISFSQRSHLAKGQRRTALRAQSNPQKEAA